MKKTLLLSCLLVPLSMTAFGQETDGSNEFAKDQGPGWYVPNAHRTIPGFDSADLEAEAVLPDHPTHNGWAGPNAGQERFREEGLKSTSSWDWNPYPYDPYGSTASQSPKLNKTSNEEPWWVENEEATEQNHRPNNERNQLDAAEEVVQ